MKNCYEFNDMLSLYIDNELSEASVQELEQHLNSCEACTKELAELRHIIELCGNMPECELPEQFMPELRAKLIGIKEKEERKSRFVELRNRYIKVCSTVAAGLLLVFILKGFFTNMGSMSIKSESGLQEKVSMSDSITQPSDSQIYADTEVGERNNTSTTAVDGTKTNGGEQVSSVIDNTASVAIATIDNTASTTSKPSEGTNSNRNTGMVKPSGTSQQPEQVTGISDNKDNSGSSIPLPTSDNSMATIVPEQSVTLTVYVNNISYESSKINTLISVYKPELFEINTTAKNLLNNIPITATEGTNVLSPYPSATVDISGSEPIVKSSPAPTSPVDVAPIPTAAPLPMATPQPTKPPMTAAAPTPAPMPAPTIKPAITDDIVLIFKVSVDKYEQFLMSLREYFGEAVVVSGAVDIKGEWENSQYVFVTVTIKTK